MPEPIDPMYRERIDPPTRGLPVPFEGDRSQSALESYVMRREYLDDVTVVWAEIYDHNTGDVLVRYEHPQLRKD